MTTTQFYQLLTVTPGPWVLERDGAIRCGQQTPLLTALGAPSAPSWAWYWRSIKANMDRDFAACVVAAEDNARGHDVTVRAALLEATVTR